VLVAIALSLPLVVLCVRAAHGEDHAMSGDVTLIELKTRDVGTGDNPTLGSYGRYGFNHPGPLWFDALAIPYRLTGELTIGVLAIGAVSLALALWVASRRGGLRWTAALLALLVWGAGPAYLGDPWEPHGLLLPCVALLLLTFDVVKGRAWSLPLVAAFACLLGAAQATLLVFALAMGAVAVVAVAVGRHWKPLLAAAAVALVLWSPTLHQQLTGDPGNLSQLVEAPGRVDDPTLGVGGSWDLLSINLGHTPPWAGFDTPLTAYSGEVDLSAAPIIGIGLVALLAALAVPRLRSPMALVAAVAVVAALVAMSQLLGPVFVWIPQWLRVVGFAAWLAVGWQVASRIPRPVFVLVVAGLVALTTVDAATDDSPPDLIGDAVRSLVDDVPDLGDDPILASSVVSSNLIFGGQFDGLEVLVLELEKRGMDPVVTAGIGDRFGAHRARPQRAGDRELLLVAADDVDGHPPGYARLAVADPVPKALREERADLLRELGHDGNVDDADMAALVRSAIGDEERRSLVERLLAIPRIPRIELLASPALAP